MSESALPGCQRWGLVFPSRRLEPPERIGVHGSLGAGCRSIGGHLILPALGRDIALVPHSPLDVLLGEEVRPVLDRRAKQDRRSPDVGWG